MLGWAGLDCADMWACCPADTPRRAALTTLAPSSCALSLEQHSMASRGEQRVTCCLAIPNRVCFVLEEFVRLLHHCGMSLTEVDICNGRGATVNEIMAQGEW